MAAKRNRNQTAQAPIALNQAVNIPLNKLVLSDANVRSIGADDKDATAAMADSIERRGLLQSLMVRPLTNGKTGMFEVPGGGRRLRALQLLAKQNRLAPDAPIPCIPKTDGLAEEDSLAENSDREQLHPLDEFRAFAALEAKGQGHEQIAAAFRVTPAVVRQRLRLASASPKLLDAYARDELDLDALMAYCLTDDHKRQNEVFKQLKKAGNHSDWTIRRMLTESTVASTDRRVRFVGLDTYLAAGGTIMRDLFQQDGVEGYLQDPTLLTRLVDEKLTALRDKLLADGWKWVEAAVEIPYQNKQGLRRLDPAGQGLSQKDDKRLRTLAKQFDDLCDGHDEDSMPDDVRARVTAVETEIAEIENRPPQFGSKQMAKAGVFVSIDHKGHASIDYGFVRKEDDQQKRKANDHDADAASSDVDERSTLPDSLVQDLTSYRTVALRNALAQDYNVAFLAVLHAMCLGSFYHGSHDGALQLTVNESFPATAPGLAEWGPAKAIDDRHKAWTAKLPRDQGQLWPFLVALDEHDRALLFADCASRTVNAVIQKHQRRAGAIRHAHQLAHALGFDMNQAGWTNTVATYLGRITKADIVAAVKEGKGEPSAQLIEHLKKPEMAKEAERLLAGTGWLPEPLRLPDLASIDAAAQADAEEQGDEDGADLPEFLNQQEEEGADAVTV